MVTLPKLRDKILTLGSILQELWAVAVWKAAYSKKFPAPLPSNKLVSESFWDEQTALGHQIIKSLIINSIMDYINH